MKPLVVVQCRSNSERLNQKALYPIAGVPMLVFLLRRLKNQLNQDSCRIVLATTESRSDDILAIWGNEEGVDVIRGSEKDLIARYILCLQRFPANTVVRVTADNPITCPEIIRWMMATQQKGRYDYVQCDNLPYGAGADVFSATALNRIHETAIDPDEREHINLHILRNPSNFTMISVYAEQDVARPDLRMTVDTYEDWMRIRTIFTPSDIEPWRISLNEAIERLDTQSAI